MDNHYTLHVLARCDAGTLPRMLLVFARRQLRLKAVHFYDLDPARPAELQVDLECSHQSAASLVDELRTLRSVAHVHAEQLPLSCGQRSEPEMTGRSQNKLEGAHWPIAQPGITTR